VLSEQRKFIKLTAVAAAAISPLKRTVAAPAAAAAAAAEGGISFVSFPGPK